MSEQSQMTADTPSETQLCKMGCGFFGSGATGWCCSKCWLDLQKKQVKVQGSAPSTSLVPAVKPIEAKVKAVKTPPTTMDVDVVRSPELPPIDKPDGGPTAVQKKRKKKASYKSMMKGIINSGTPERDIEKEKESLRRVTGGGAFVKVDKI